MLKEHNITLLLKPIFVFNPLSQKLQKQLEEEEEEEDETTENPFKKS